MTIVTRMDYCQFLIGTQINYTCTYFADHKEFLSHDAVRRYLQSDRITGRMIWDQVKSQVITSPKGYLLFDDTVADHNFSCDIEPVYKQWSGNVKHVMAPKRATFRGIGIVTCVYVNPDIDKFWVIDHRIYDPQHDGLNKLQHVEQMLENAITHKKLPFRGVLFDTWKPPSVGGTPKWS